MARIPPDARFVDLEQPLHETAKEKVGFDDFGDPAYLEGLRVLLRAYDEEARFTPSGRMVAQHQLLDLLKKRLRAGQMWREMPEVLETEVPRPIVILGLVRTGSTALHYLMGQDPGLQSLEYWLAQSPQPRPPQGEWEAHPDYRRAVAEIEAMYASSTALKAIHFMRADLSEECRHLLAQSFTDDGFEVGTTVPSYSRWYEAADLRASYAHHRKLVQLIGAKDERRWLLKYPVHLRHLGSFLSVYPDACVVQTHRDPATVLRSYSSLVAAFRSFYERDIDRHAIARAQLEIWAAGAERGIEVRRRRNPAQFFDLHYREFVSDPIAAVKRIYGHFGQTLSAEGERRLVAWRDENPHAKHGRHAYAEEDIGVTDAEIHERFSAYMKEFGIEKEKRAG